MAARKPAKPSRKKPAKRPANSPRKGRGRPSGFKPEYVAQAKKLCEHGLTDEEIAEFFGIAARSLYRWKERYPAFCAALKVGKEKADARVVRSLYHRAVGYTYDAVKITQFQGTAVITPFKEHVPPDVTAAIFWLKNRDPESWRDKQDHEHGVTDELGELLAHLDGRTKGIPGAGAA